MKDFGRFLSKLGNLHDCTVMVFEWKPRQQAMAFDIEDLYFNSQGFPEYPGALAGRIALDGVQHVAIDLRDIEGPLRIDEFSLEAEGPVLAAVSVTFWPAGKIKAGFRHAIFPNIPLP